MGRRRPLERRLRLPKTDGAAAAALRSHLDALVNQWKTANDDPAHRPQRDETRPPFPTLADAFVRLLGHGWDADATARPHAHRTTVVLHVDVATKAAELHLGPALTDAERRYLSCDAKIETWFERDGTPIGAARTTRELPRRLRRALEHRAKGCCEVPGCGATAGLHAHHLIHWEDGGPTELWNLTLRQDIRDCFVRLWPISGSVASGPSVRRRCTRSPRCRVGASPPRGSS